FFAMRRGGKKHPRRQLLRIVEGITGEVDFKVELSPRFDYGEIKPWICRHRDGRAYTACGSNQGLFISCETPLTLAGEHDIRGRFTIRAGQRIRFSLEFAAPESLDPPLESLPLEEIDRHFDETLQWWRYWSAKIRFEDDLNTCVLRSAIVLRVLGYAPTGAIIAAPTTSLPETPGGERNWDYRYSWIRDSIFTVHALADLGCVSEANEFRRFIQRSAAGNAEELQVLYAVDGKRRLTEVVLDHLEGYRGARPVRIGNAADEQFQSDMYGLILELSWRWSERGNSPDAHYWDFLVEIVNATIEHWQQPDRGIWEIRSEPRHFVHSKVMCWAAVNRGIGLAEKHALKAPLTDWDAARDAIRNAVESRGYDAQRGVFVQDFGAHELDAALLLLPDVDFVDYDDPRMIRTVDAIRADLDEQGLILRYRSKDGLRGGEGVFLACTFWLVKCLALQGRLPEAQQVFDRVLRCANDLGLFAEEYNVAADEMLGNFPQGLTHLSHISAALALARARGEVPESPHETTQARRADGR
ncbi:MAG: glycoside hydrolase family 15 protein, partial [Burkholderiales bacterium]|nr:glycoside hydrolase family 15 protein [Burkholderiales bacterium]